MASSSSFFDRWRRIFAGTGVDLIDAILYAITVAAEDCPEELMKRRAEILNKIGDGISDFAVSSNTNVAVGVSRSLLPKIEGADVYKDCLNSENGDLKAQNPGDSGVFGRKKIRFIIKQNRTDTEETKKEMMVNETKMSCSGSKEAWLQQKLEASRQRMRESYENIEAQKKQRRSKLIPYQSIPCKIGRTSTCTRVNFGLPPSFKAG